MNIFKILPNVGSEPTTVRLRVFNDGPTELSGTTTNSVD